MEGWGAYEVAWGDGGFVTHGLVAFFRLSDPSQSVALVGEGAGESLH